METLFTAIEKIPVRLDGFATSEALAEDVGMLSRAISMLTARLAGRIAAQRALGPDPDGLSLTRWTAVHADVTGGEARSLVSLASAMTAHPDTAESIEAARISHTRARMLSRAAQAHPKMYERDEELLLHIAESQDVTDLNRAVRYWRSCADDEAAEGTAGQQRMAAYLHASVTMGGMVRLDGYLDPATGEALLTALDAATPPPVQGDNRAPANARAEALGTICEEWLRVSGKTDGGLRAAVTLLVDLDTLQGRPGKHRDLEYTGPVSGDVARRILCDCDVSRVITRGPSEVLDVGRATRVISPAQRKALVVRDRHCRFRGCDRPPKWCDAHHIIPWESGGETNLDDLVLVCRRHHSMIHEGRAVVVGHDVIPVAVAERSPP